MDKSVNEKLLDEQIYWVNNILKEYTTVKIKKEKRKIKSFRIPFIWDCQKNIFLPKLIKEL